MIPSLSQEHALALAQVALDRANVGIFWTTVEGRLLYVNAMAEQLLGEPVEQLTGALLTDKCPELTAELWRELWKEIKRNGSFTVEVGQTIPTKQLRTLEMNVHFCVSKGQEFACAFLQNVDERKLLQELKNEFVSTVSHELRTPVTIIREGVAQVLEGLRGDITPDQRRALTIAITGIDRLARMINDLLDISKMEAGKISLRRQWVDLGALAQEVVSTLLPRVSERDLKLEVVPMPSPVLAYADSERLSQVLTNLISNAIKFTQKGRIVVEILSNDEGITCSVADTGQGIAAQDIPKVFHKFEQLGHTSYTGEKGTGLGLSICKGIVELHKGRIFIESAVGQGTRFTFILPHTSPRECFREQLQLLLHEAIRSNATLSTLVFRRDGESIGWEERLLQAIHMQSGRKTDVIVKGENVVWMALPSTVRKEACRIADKIQQAFSEEASESPKKTLASYVLTFPEDYAQERDFLNHVFES